MKVLVTGGTGATGRRVVARLLARGDAVRVLARRPERAVGLGPVELHPGDLRDPASLVGVGRDVDAVIACTGTRSYVGRNGGPAVDAIGTRHLVAALAADARARPSSPPQLVWMSAFGLDRRSIFLDLFSLALNRYFRWKAEAEAAVREWPGPYTIVRPVELHDGPPRHGPRLNQSEPLSLLRRVSRDTVAEVLVHVTGRPEAYGRSFELCDGAAGPLDAQLLAMRPDGEWSPPARSPLW